MSTRDVSTTRATLLVAQREVREAFRRKSIWVVLVVLFLGSSAAMILPEVLDSGTTRYDVAVVAPAGAARAFEDTTTSIVRGLDARVRYRIVDSERQARALVDRGTVDLAVVLAREPEVVVRAGEHATLVGGVRQALASNALAARLRATGLTSAEVDDMLRAAPPRLVEVDVEDSDRQASAAILSVILYLVILMLMIQAATGVAIEKANRISEVLLAVVKPGSLLFGKIIGVGVVGAVSLVAGAIPVVVKAIAGGNLPAGLGPALAGGAAWFVLGVSLYLTIAGALGALVERQEEAGSVLAPLSLLLIGTYLVAQTTASNPSFANSGFGIAFAVFPLTSPIVMPMRIALGDATVVEIVVSLVLLAVSLAFAVRVGAAIYRRGIVHTGRRLRLREALRNP